MAIKDFEHTVFGAMSSFCTLSQDFATHFLYVTSHNRTLVFHYVVGDVYPHYGLSPIN